MKRGAMALVAVLLLGLAGCESETAYGPCVGINDERNPKLTYKASTQNIIVGAIFIESIVVPLVVLFTEIECPVGRRAP